MKICWDNIKDLRLTPSGYFKKKGKANPTFKYVDSCENCKEPFLARYHSKGRFCETSCRPTGENHWSSGKENKGSKKWMLENNPMNNSESRKKVRNANFKGESYNYLHTKAWDVFGKDYCENCNLTLQESYDIYKQRLSMHNTLEPKDYTVMKQYAWQCLCKKCHMKIDNVERDSKTGKWKEM